MNIVISFGVFAGGVISKDKYELSENLAGVGGFVEFDNDTPNQEILPVDDLRSALLHIAYGLAGKASPIKPSFELGIKKLRFSRGLLKLPITCEGSGDTFEIMSDVIDFNDSSVSDNTLESMLDSIKAGEMSVVIDEIESIFEERTETQEKFLALLRKAEERLKEMSERY